MSFDEGIQATNDDATVCKTNAVKLKYWDDPFVQYFAKAVSSKAPEINRGYYIRSQIFKAYVDHMIQVCNFIIFRVINIIHLDLLEISSSPLRSIYYHFRLQMANYKS